MLTPPLASAASAGAKANAVTTGTLELVPLLAGRIGAPKLNNSASAPAVESSHGCELTCSAEGRLKGSICSMLVIKLTAAGGTMSGMSSGRSNIAVRSSRTESAGKGSAPTSRRYNMTPMLQMSAIAAEYSSRRSRAKPAGGSAALASGYALEGLTSDSPASLPLLARVLGRGW